AFGNNLLQLWKFHVDWTTPANSTFAGPQNVPVASFSAACNGGGTCIPQLGTSQQLDSLADRLMFRLAYRNFSDHESLVVNHAVTAGSSVGVRWYELRSPNGAPAIYQQGTFAPDSYYRWMGSIAMDQAGNIALGYSKSSSGIYPAVAFTGRVPTDPLGTLQAETLIQSGGGSQLRTLSRWGDYSSMSIDPVDDCTFWYTNEYLKSSGTFNWSTIIGTFRFPGCGPTTPDFSISATPASVSVAAGGATTGSTVTVTSLNTFSSPVALTVICPTGVTCSLNPTSVTPTSGGTATSTLRIVTSSTLPGGTYTATVTGTSGTLTHTTSVTVKVQDFSISASPASLSVAQGGAAGSSTVTVTSLGGFSSAVGLTASCPTELTCSLSPPSVTPASGGTASSTLSIGAGTANIGVPYTVTVTGTSGTLSHSTTVSVTVTAPAPSFTLSASPSSLTVKRGTTGSSSITVTPSNGFAGTVSFSVTGLPSGTSASFNPTSVTGSGSTTMTLKVNKNTKSGTVAILTVKGTSGTLSSTTTVTLTVQ
ncbi:MAG: hypothetical protein KGN36_09725, partial [Acidobacteriota bacterium]|nr:hypothetical protein [Acidobacteriota bacterium]